MSLFNRKGIRSPHRLRFRFHATSLLRNAQQVTPWVLFPPDASSRSSVSTCVSLPAKTASTPRSIPRFSFSPFFPNWIPRECSSSSPRSLLPPNDPPFSRGWRRGGQRSVRCPSHFSPIGPSISPWPTGDSAVPREPSGCWWRRYGDGRGCRGKCGIGRWGCDPGGDA